MGASMVAPPAYTLYHHAASYNNGGGMIGAGDNAAVRAWQQQQQQLCGSKGTGVFIPRSSPGSVHPKKKGKSKGNVHKAVTGPSGAGEETILSKMKKKKKEKKNRHN
ncbi:hypothetical protein OsJ_18454 [Oryza sativa Japonica Group]|uniref:Uncharacterized protein n=1 Tax=Oryza sativa subsp. japonica TaxID=39947 RepID=B9FIB8_ORYSJ|nr:hypothetical protein OsJ_18454 [Oryza sativa Japonica Group]